MTTIKTTSLSSADMKMDDGWIHPSSTAALQTLMEQMDKMQAQQTLWLQQKEEETKQLHERVSVELQKKQDELDNLQQKLEQQEERIVSLQQRLAKQQHHLRNKNTVCPNCGASGKEEKQPHEASSSEEEEEFHEASDGEFQVEPCHKLGETLAGVVAVQQHQLEATMGLPLKHKDKQFSAAFASRKIEAPPMQLTQQQSEGLLPLPKPQLAPETSSEQRRAAEAVVSEDEKEITEVGETKDDKAVEESMVETTTEKAAETKGEVSKETDEDAVQPAPPNDAVTPPTHNHKKTTDDEPSWTMDYHSSPSIGVVVAAPTTKQASLDVETPVITNKKQNDVIIAEAPLQKQEDASSKKKKKKGKRFGRKQTPLPTKASGKDKNEPTAVLPVLDEEQEDEEEEQVEVAAVPATEKEAPTGKAFARKQTPLPKSVNQSKNEPPASAALLPALDEEDEGPEEMAPTLPAAAVPPAKPKPTGKAFARKQTPLPKGNRHHKNQPVTTTTLLPVWNEEEDEETDSKPAAVVGEDDDDLKPAAKRQESARSIPPAAALTPAGKILSGTNNGAPKSPRAMIQPSNHDELLQFGHSLTVPPVEVNYASQDQPPLEEQVTLPSVFDNSTEINRKQLSQRSGGWETERLYIAPSDNFSVGSTTVATSTYHEERQNLVNQTLLDPHGEYGTYTGTILSSTGMPHGLGKMIYESDGRTYEGDWRHGMWHGFGNAKFGNGDSYEGEYKFDQRHGRGLYQWKDGRQYDGEFAFDKRHGKGRFEWPDMSTYEGDFHQGQREGEGVYTFKDGGHYKGKWVDGFYDGYGECFWSDGRCYKGEWRAGMAHGRGVEAYADGTIRHEGMWENDDPVK